jgi:hypothetical protein
MPEHLKALVVILLLASLVFAIARKASYELIGQEDFLRRRNLWFGLVGAAFLAHNYWIYIFIASLLLLATAARETNRIALFFVVLFAVPATTVEIPGLGLINYLFAMGHVRLLTLLILLPLLFRLQHRGDIIPFGRLKTDIALAVYLLLVFSLQLRETTVTDTLRQGFYLFIDIFLPYFVISRSIQGMHDFKGALHGFVMAAMALALIGIFEFAKHWQLYSAWFDAVNISHDYFGYALREGRLRASASIGQSIAFGYVMVVALGFYLFLGRFISNPLHRRLGWALLVGGAVASLSRGPWVGALALFMVFLATGPNALRRLVMLFFAGIFSLPLLAVIPGGNKVIDLLPFIGSVDKFNIDYRDKLIDNTLIVIDRNPWFGSVDFARAPEMQEMIQGEGIIDVVNTYLLMALQIGYVGTGLFVGFFVLVGWSIFAGFRRLPEKGGEEHLLGRALLAALLAVLLIIFTVSPITVIPVVYWSVAGLGVAYTQMCRRLLE